MAASAAIAAAGENMNALTATKSENALDPITCLLRQPQEPISLGGKAFATWWYSPGNVVAVAQQVNAGHAASAGCTAPEFMAVSGHATLSEAQKYIVAVEQERMAEAAMAKRAAGTRQAQTVPNVFDSGV